MKDKEIFKGLSEYSRVPESLKISAPNLSDLEKKDPFGVEDRFAAIKEHYPGGQKAIDLGGNSGFFSLSMIDEGLLERSVVFDSDESALEAGRKMASWMNLSQNIDFKNKTINLEFLRSYESNVDTVIALNLLHHAGVLFDEINVKNAGWYNYAGEWLSELNRICDICVIGLGFKKFKPAYWDVPKYKRPFLFKKLAKDNGWESLYDANVQDIYNYGVQEAEGLRTGSPDLSSFFKFKTKNIIKSIKRIIAKLANKKFSKRDDYHLYILEKERE